MRLLQPIRRSLRQSPMSTESPAMGRLDATCRRGPCSSRSSDRGFRPWVARDRCCGLINARGRPWVLRPLPIDYERCCSDRLNPPLMSDTQRGDPQDYRAARRHGADRSAWFLAHRCAAGRLCQRASGGKRNLESGDPGSRSQITVTRARRFSLSSSRPRTIALFLRGYSSEFRAAYAHSTARILPKALRGMEVTDRASNGVEIIG